MENKNKLDLKSQLTKLETRLQNMIENGVERLFASDFQSNDLMKKLLKAMRDGIEIDPQGVLLAPNLFVLVVSIDQQEIFLDNLEFQEILITTLQEVAEESGLIFPTPPILRISTDHTMQAGQVKVLASSSLENISQTTDVIVESHDKLSVIPTNAFLIVNGISIFPLEEIMINIGRRPDNHLVIDDQSVSRIHAQLRVVEGRYVIFDLGSTGGTFINGKAVEQHVLSSGDVISLSGFPLVYGQDEDERGETQDLFLGKKNR
jgi:hypothetical protein